MKNNLWKKTYCLLLATIMTLCATGCEANDDPHPSVDNNTDQFNSTYTSPTEDVVTDSHTHSFSESVVSASCETGGYILFECECGDSYIAEEVAPLGHKYDKKIVDETGSSNGYTLYTCSVCGSSYKEDFSAQKTPSTTPVNSPEHSHTYMSTTVAPTCTAQGYTTFTCSCGSSYKDNHTQATGHSWGTWTTTKEATTSAAGEQVRTCSNCGATETQSIPKLTVSEPTEPTVCQHNWQAKYYPEQGHYTEYFVICSCGQKFPTTADWIAHTNNYSGEELFLQHGSNASGRDYIIDSPERWEWVCSGCGAVTNTQP